MLDDPVGTALAYRIVRSVTLETRRDASNSHISRPTMCPTVLADATTEEDAMKFTMVPSRRKTALRLIRVMAIDATFAAACGALYGFVFGGLGAMVNSEPARLVSIAGCFALCGAVAGAVVGVCGAILCTGDETPDSRLDLTKAPANKRGAVEAIRHLMVPGQRHPEVDHVAASSPDRRRTLGAAAKHPLSC